MGDELEFLGTLAHDLKSPLAAMMGYADLIADPAYGDIDELKVEYARKIRRVGDLMLMQINTLVFATRIDAGKIQWHDEEMDVAALIGDLEDTFGFMASQGDVDLTVETVGGLVIVGDGQRIRLALQNLLSNALRHTPARGRIRVVIEPAARGRVRCSVFNTGSYIEQDDFQRLFQKFGQVRGTREGTGLGLYVVRRIVEHHGGQISVESVRGEGTWFHFDVPSIRLEEPRAAAPGRILVVGGPPVEAEVVAGLLRDEGHGVSRVSGCLEALQIAAIDPPDLFVAFAEQPDLPVEELPRSLNRQPPVATIPVLLVGDRAGPEFVGAVQMDDPVALRQAVRQALSGA